MALPVGNNQNNKELELVITLLEKTIQELKVTRQEVKDTKQEFEEYKKTDQEKQKKFTEYVNKIVDTLREKDFNPRIEVPTPKVFIGSDIIETVKKAVEPKRFWSFTGKEVVLLGMNFITIILLSFSLYYNFTSSRTIKTQSQNLFENQKLLYDIYRQETKFWYSKEHQKAFTSSVQNGELENNIAEDKKSFQEKLKEDKETNKKKNKLGK